MELIARAWLIQASGGLFGMGSRGRWLGVRGGLILLRFFGQLWPNIGPCFLAKHLPSQHPTGLRLDSASLAMIQITATSQALIEVLLIQPMSHSKLPPDLRSDLVLHARILA